MTKQKPLIYLYNLFCFTSISNVSFIIYSSSIIPRTCAQMHSSWNQSHFYWSISQISWNLTEVSLDKRCKPSTVNSLVNKVLVESQVPEVSVITCNQSQWVFNLFLHPLYSPLPWTCDIITIGEIKSILKHSLHILKEWDVLMSWGSPEWDQLSICNFEYFGFV